MCPLLEVQDLFITIGATEILKGISFHVATKETVALVGESGCGKSITALAILRLLRKATITGSIRFGGRELLPLRERIMRRYRGGSIAYIPQDPLTSLNPLMTIGNQIIEAIHQQRKISKSVAWNEAIRLLHIVGIPDAEERINYYPHQLSGGQRQRVLIAIALSCQPQLIIADEPTTALDVTTQAQILQLLKKLQKELGLSLLLITHDFGVVSGMCDRVIVMRDGTIVEEGTPEVIYHDPADPYTRNIVVADHYREHEVVLQREPILQAHAVCKWFPTVKGTFNALNNVDLTLFKGETLALVGESGSGKSTLAHLMMHLIRPSEGEICFHGTPLRELQSKKIQIIFQNPYSSLDPMMTVRQTLKEPFIIHDLPCDEEVLTNLLQSVGLSKEFLDRKPHGLSGGQRQRINIARALAVEPEVLICDEPLSALDLATQNQIIALMQKLKLERGLTYLFITHDLATAKIFADRVAVMHRGQIIEIDSVINIFNQPKHIYTQTLLAAIPLRDPRKEKIRQSGIEIPVLPACQTISNQAE
jgi:peptide/nickel transport system ATP-binding protein